MNSLPGRLRNHGLGVLIVLSATLAASAQDVYQAELKPMVQQYCSACHGGFGGRGGRGGVSFGMRAVNGDFVRDYKLWKQVLNAVADRSMPQDAARANFSEAQRQRMVRIIDDCLRNADLSALPPDPGSAPLRYLTRYEYASAIRDLLGVSGIPEDQFPGEMTYSDMDAPSGPSARFLLSRYLTVAEIVLATAPRERVVTVEPTETLSRRDAARRTLMDMQTRAYRRPATDADMERIMKLFDQVESLNGTYEDSMRKTLTGVFSSPSFLTHIEQPRRGQGPQRIDPFDLASRLSFFIWSSVPDEPLIRLAATGTLTEPAVLEQQVRRMLADPRARALSENFGLLWLGVSKVRAKIAPTIRATDLFIASPTTRPLTLPPLDAMRDDAITFLDDVFRQDKSVLSLVDDDRGGVLQLPAVLVATAAGGRTSPPRRGKWVLQTLLGELVPRGPYNSCTIPSSGKGPEGPPLYAKLAVNRENANCAICHERLDPPGLALESFDAMGQKRESVANISALKQTILDRKSEFMHTLVEEMLAFALGRSIEPWDRPTIDQITKSLTEREYRSSVLILGIAQSLPFNFRRPEQDRGN